MNYIYLAVAALAAIHAVSYGVWLNRQGNRAGALFLFILSLACVGLPVFRLVSGP